ncbi:MAG: zinc ABC transporter substrate-binding protein, partial [Actinomycetota bacterium]|nr:zinc ABC transporter substrate-binding protein [Actinomycetota bacterium]
MKNSGTRRILAATASAALLAAGSTGCDSAAEAAGVTIQASFYPLQWISEQVGGDIVEVSSLTPPGAEPHDLELSP